MKRFETESILAAYREELARRNAPDSDSPRERLVQVLEILAAGEGRAPNESPNPLSKEKPLKPRILLIVEITVRAGREEALLAELVNMEAASRAEEGCQEYTMLRSLSEPRRFVVYEIWQSAEHLEAHRQTPHYRAFGPAVGELLAGAPEYLEVKLPAAS